MSDIHTPSRQECWDGFWDVMTTVLANGMKRGWTPPEPVSAAA